MRHQAAKSQCRQKRSKDCLEVFQHLEVRKVRRSQHRQSEWPAEEEEVIRVKVLQRGESYQFKERVSHEAYGSLDSET